MTQHRTHHPPVGYGWWNSTGRCVKILLWTCLFLTHDADAWSSRTTKQHLPRRELIVQGQVADPTAFQYFALTANDAYASTVDNVCGAALIHSDILLTAAHCQGLFNYGAWMFNPTTKQFDRMMKIVEQWRHPNFNLMNNSYYNWDLLVMRLEEPVLDIQPVALNNDPQVPSIDEVLKAIGFGAREYGEELSTSLLVGELQYMSPQLCENKIFLIVFLGEYHSTIEKKLKICWLISAWQLIHKTKKR